MIRVENLTKRYGSISAIENISFKVEKGEILGFLGPNGAGKSTTMRIITGNIPATSGSAFVEDFDITEKPLEVKKRLGYLPENTPLYQDMTVRSYLNFVASVKGMRGKQQLAGVNQVIESCGLGDVANRLIGHISKGFRQRVGIAQALVNDPPVLILDEPTTGLDPSQIVEIRNLIRDLRGSRTIILSTHILPEVSVICDRVLIIHHGRVAAEGGVETLTSDIHSDKVIRISALGPGEEIKNGLLSVPGVKEVNTKMSERDGEVHLELKVKGGTEIRSELAAAVSASNGRLTELFQEKATLEELFVKIVGGERQRTQEETHV